MANEGTLFLDEIGDVPPKVQVDLLRVVQERELKRVGGSETIKVDFRLVTATHRDLEAEVAAGRFRDDFYFRINVFQIPLPPLRERSGDVPALAEHFLQQFATQMNRRISGFSQDAMAALMTYPWPGNVRELANAIERAVVLCRGDRIEASHFPFAGPPASADHSLAAIEEAHIRQMLAACSYNVAQAARELDIDRVTLYNKMKKFGIERP